MKKKTSIIIGVIVVIIITMIGGGVAVSGILNPYEKQIKLGYKMINEGKYEEAILAFNTAIEIDQKREKAYIGLADTYVTRCDETTVDDASDALKRGYEQSQSEKIVQGYIDSAQALYDKDKKDWAVKLLENGYETTKDDRIKAKKEEFIKKISFELLDKLFKYCESDNLEQVRTIMNTEEFINIASYASDSEPIGYYPNSSSDNKNGKGIGIYSVGSQYYLYFGDYVDNLRNGNGIWIHVNENNKYSIFNGNWNDDKPNGEGKLQSYSNNELMDQENGILIDGLWNGIVLEYNVCDDGYKFKISQKYNNGIIIPIGDAYESKGKMCYKIGDGFSVSNINDESGGKAYKTIPAEDINKVRGILGFNT